MVFNALEQYLEVIVLLCGSKVIQIVESSHRTVHVVQTFDEFAVLGEFYDYVKVEFSFVAVLYSRFGLDEMGDVVCLAEIGEYFGSHPVADA